MTIATIRNLTDSPFDILTTTGVRAIWAKGELTAEFADDVLAAYRNSPCLAIIEGKATPVPVAPEVDEWAELESVARALGIKAKSTWSVGELRERIMRAAGG